tara:strand:- start:3 stop:2249 length:2247 start_codon:yes stop_codon:yes gene_type:complete
MHAQNTQFKIISNQNNSIVVDFILTDYVIDDYKVLDGDMHQKIKALDAVAILKKGHPEVLKFTTNLQMPNEGVSSVNVISTSFDTKSDINLIPSKGNLYRNINPETIPYEKAEIYQQNNSYPGSLVVDGVPYIQRDVRGQTITLFPFQYNPVLKQLRVYNKVRFEVNFNTKTSGINELDELRKSSYNKLIEDSYTRRYLNYIPKKYTSLGEEGSILIITPSEYISNLSSYIEWKRQAGFEVELVDISTIGNTQLNISNYVKDYYQQNPDFLYLIIVGDHNKVCAYNCGSTGGWMSEIKWSDAKYGLVSNSNDWYPDIYVGRLSPSNLTTLNIMLQRNLEYDITPDTSSYYKRALGLGSNEGAGYGDDGEADWQHLRNIRTDLLNYGYTDVYEFYDGSHGGQDANGNPNSNMVSNAVNQGIGLFNYTGHGDLNTCITGNYNSNHINSGTNNGMYPFVISVACNNGTFTSGTCISEAWQRASNLGTPTGAIAAAGSSILMSWAPPMATQDEIVDILVESYTNNKMQTLGGLFYSGQMKMLDDYNNADGREVIETWVFFGDPSTMIRTDIPQDLTVTHLSSELVGVSSLNVFSSTEDAVVTLKSNGSIISKSSVQNGQALLQFNSIELPDTLEIVVSAYNKVPYFGQFIVKDLPNPYGTANELLIGPNPVDLNGSLHLIFELESDQEVSFNIFNQLGQMVFSNVVDLDQGFYGPNYTDVSIDLRKIGITTGQYIINAKYNGQTFSKTFFVP